jgi:hypothetical protein
MPMNVFTSTKDQHMIGALHLPTHRRKPNLAGSYATDDDFQRLFATEINEFFRLALQLTANAEKVERCLILALRDCLGSSNISRDFAQVWARRMIIRNAIHLVWGIDNDFARDTESEFHLQPSEYRIEELWESIAVLDLANFERMVFVICVLERLSTLDCALLLRRSPKDVNDAIVRATNCVDSVEDLKPPTILRLGSAELRMDDRKD